MVCLLRAGVQHSAPRHRETPGPGPTAGRATAAAREVRGRPSTFRSDCDRQYRVRAAGVRGDEHRAPAGTMLMSRRVIAQAAALSIAVGPAAQAAFGAPCEPQATMATEFGRFVPWQRIVKSNEMRPLDSGEELRYVRLQLRN